MITTISSYITHARAHQPQASHFSSSTKMTPVSADCSKASRGHAGTHGASSHNLQTMVTLTKGCRRTTLIRDLRGLKDLAFSNAQASSQRPQPVHLPGSAEMNCLETDVFSIFHISICAPIPHGSDELEADVLLKRDPIQSISFYR